MKAQLKNQRMVSSLAQRTAGASKSMASRYVSASYGNTLLRRDESDLSMSPSGRNDHNNSPSLHSVNREDRYQRSQLNIDKKIREDFDRL